jgi:hypothetical protein
MKKLVFLFCSILSINSCENPDPDLAALVIGKYYLTETNQDTVINTVWTISGIDHSQVNLNIDIETLETLNPNVINRRSVVISNIRVKKRDVVLEFANRFTDGGMSYEIVGTARMVAPDLICDLIVTDPSGKSVHWNQTLVRRQ